MVAPWSSNWAGSLPTDPSTVCPTSPATLKKPGDEAEPCTITCDLKLQQHPLVGSEPSPRPQGTARTRTHSQRSSSWSSAASQAAGSQLLLCSNARMVEVSVARPGDTSTSYLQTVRCQPLQGAQHNYQAIIPLQARTATHAHTASWVCLHLSHLSCWCPAQHTPQSQA